VSQGAVLLLAECLGGCRAADRRRGAGHRHGDHARGDSVSPDGPLQPSADPQRCHRCLDGIHRRLHQLLCRWRDGRRHRHAAGACLWRRVPFRAQARNSRIAAAGAHGGGGHENMTALWDFFAVPLAYPFMQRALLVEVLIGAVSAVLSCYLVLKGWALMGDAISHAILPGIVLAYVLGMPLSLGAFAAGLTCATLTGYLKENSRIREDTVMGIVFSGMFGF